MDVLYKFLKQFSYWVFLPDIPSIQVVAAHILIHILLVYESLTDYIFRNKSLKLLDQRTYAIDQMFVPLKIHAAALTPTVGWY